MANSGLTQRSRVHLAIAVSAQGGNAGYDLQNVAYDPDADVATVRGNIAEFAEENLGNTDYALDSRQGDFGSGDWKCNQFVRDAIEAGGGKAPTYPGGKWPIRANDWANPSKTIPGWRVESTPLPGDVAAFPRAGTSGHVGIYVGGWGRTVIGAGQSGVGYSNSHFFVGAGFGRFGNASGPIVYRRWVGLSGVGI